MKTTAASRIAAALMSLTITLSIVDAISIYAYPKPSQTDLTVAGGTQAVAAATVQTGIPKSL